jgi:predicted Zn-dependent peptidase
MICAPVMDPAELEKERHVILEELASVEDSPGELAGILIDETVWPRQPLGRNVGGTPQSVEALSPAEVTAYFQRQYVPSNIVLAVAGNVDADRIFEVSERYLAGLPAAEPGPWFPVQPEAVDGRVALREKKTEQAHVCVAYPTVHLDHPDRFAVDLLSTLLGEGMSSRLFLDLREERALVYDVHSYPSEYRDAGSFTVYAGCDPENVVETAEAVLDQVDRVAREGIPSAELQKARAMARGRLQLRMEDTRAVAGWWGSQLLLLEQPLSVDEAVARIDAITADDLVRVAGQMLVRSRARLAVVGPFDDPAPIAALL